MADSTPRNIIGHSILYTNNKEQHQGTNKLQFKLCLVDLENEYKVSIQEVGSGNETVVYETKILPIAQYVFQQRLRNLEKTGMYNRVSSLAGPQNKSQTVLFELKVLPIWSNLDN